MGLRVKKHRNVSVTMITYTLTSSDVFHPLLLAQDKWLGFKFRGAERCSWTKAERRIEFCTMQEGASVIAQGWLIEDTIVSTFSSCFEFLPVLYFSTSARPFV